MPILVFFLAHFYLAAFCQSFFLHRYASHKLYEMPVFWERFFYVLTYLTQGLLDMNPRCYALMHRMHHAYTETPKDPHSPVVLKNPASMLANTIRVFAGLNTGRVAAEPRFQGGIPEWPAFDRFFDNYFARSVVCLGYVLFYRHYATAPWMYGLLFFHFFMGPFEGALVNWAGHKYGYKNIPMKNNARVFLPVDWLGLGEMIHNNHHAQPHQPNFAAKKNEFDPIYPVTVFFSRIGILRFNSPQHTR